MQETLVQSLGQGRFTEEGIGYPLQYSWASLVAQLIKNLLAMQETWVQSLGWEDSLEKGKGYPLQYSGLENSNDCIVRGVAKSQKHEVHIPASSLCGLDLCSGHVSSLVSLRERC